MMDKETLEKSRLMKRRQGFYYEDLGKILSRIKTCWFHSERKGFKPILQHMKSNEGNTCTHEGSEYCKNTGRAKQKGRKSLERWVDSPPLLDFLTCKATNSIFSLFFCSFPGIEKEFRNEQDRLTRLRAEGVKARGTNNLFHTTR